MNTMKNRMIALVMIVMMTVGFIPVMTELTLAENVYAAVSYDRAKALEYADANWNNKKGKCAEYISDIIEFAGISSSVAWSRGCTTLHRQLMASGLGCEYEITLQSDKTIKASDYEGKLEPGDIIFYYCDGCNDGCPYIHVVLYAGMDENGYARCYSHNNANNAARKYYYNTRCYDCNTVLKRAYIFHFNTEDSSEEKAYDSCSDKCQYGIYKNEYFYIPKNFDGSYFVTDTSKASTKIAADTAYSLYVGTVYRNTKVTSNGGCTWVANDSSHIFQIGYSTASAKKRLSVIYDLMAKEGCPVILRLGDTPGISLVVVGVKAGADTLNLSYNDILIYYPYAPGFMTLAEMQNTPYWYGGDIETGWSLIACYTGKVFKGFKIK